jgi:hypothetical protein
MPSKKRIAAMCSIAQLSDLEAPLQRYGMRKTQCLGKECRLRGADQDYGLMTAHDVRTSARNSIPLRFSRWCLFLILRYNIFCMFKAGADSKSRRAYSKE